MFRTTVAFTGDPLVLFSSTPSTSPEFEHLTGDIVGAVRDLSCFHGEGVNYLR
ncbi:hypothetical protein Hanom_Chr09g00803341 [Helianthus anomalus]